MNKAAEIVLSIALRPLLYGLYVLAGWFPRDPKMWVFGCWDGRRFADNAGALFRYCHLQEDSPITAIWISKRADIVSELCSEGYRAYHAWSIGGLIVCLRAGLYVFDGYTKDINHWTSRGAKRVLLRHGAGGLKKVEREIDTPGHRLFELFHGNIGQKVFWRYLLPWHCTKLDLVLAASEQHLDEAQKSLGVAADVVTIAGLPRNDVIFAPGGAISMADDLQNWIRRARDESMALFLYMPTFRDTHVEAFPFSWSDWDQTLGDCGARIIAHKHFADPNPHPSHSFANVYFLEKSVDAYPLFKDVDGLITDYSSVAFDFMLTGKPIIYFVHDFEEYVARSRSLRFDINSVTPGPKVRTLKELADALAQVKADSNGGVVSVDVAYERVRDFFHAYRDDRSSERAYEAIMAKFIEES